MLTWWTRVHLPACMRSHNCRTYFSYSIHLPLIAYDILTCKEPTWCWHSSSWNSKSRPTPAMCASWVAHLGSHLRTGMGWSQEADRRGSGCTATWNTPHETRTIDSYHHTVVLVMFHDINLLGNPEVRHTFFLTETPPQKTVRLCEAICKSTQFLWWRHSYKRWN